MPGGQTSLTLKTDGCQRILRGLLSRTALGIPNIHPGTSGRRGNSGSCRAQRGV